MSTELGCRTLLLFQWGLVCGHQGLKFLGQAGFMARMLWGPFA